ASRSLMTFSRSSTAQPPAPAPGAPPRNAATQERTWPARATGPNTPAAAVGSVSVPDVVAVRGPVAVAVSPDAALDPVPAAVARGPAAAVDAAVVLPIALTSLGSNSCTKSRTCHRHPSEGCGQPGSVEPHGLGGTQQAAGPQPMTVVPPPEREQQEPRDRAPHSASVREV